VKPLGWFGRMLGETRGETAQKDLPMTSPERIDNSVGSQDGTGAGDHDQAYRFGWKPRSSVPFPFNTRQYARLLVLRSRVQNGLLDDIVPLPQAA
jgi:hypothetical protein